MWRLAAAHGSQVGGRGRCYSFQNAAPGLGMTVGRKERPRFRGWVVPARRAVVREGR